MKWRNTIAVLALLPVNAMALGYGLLAAGMTGWAANWDEKPYEPPLTELGVTAGVVTIVGVVLWSAGLRRAAAVQLLPLLVLGALMLG